VAGRDMLCRIVHLNHPLNHPRNEGSTRDLAHQRSLKKLSGKTLRQLSRRIEILDEDSRTERLGL
jgi:hypothetical protein